MADSKRNSVAGKVATPKTAGGTATPPATRMMDQTEALAKSMGARVKLTTAAPHNQSYEGTLHTACPILNMVVLNTRATSNSAPTTSAQPADYHFFPISSIQQFQIMSLAASTDAAQPAAMAVDGKRSQEREQARVNKLKELELNRGKGVTKEAQDIFDALNRIGYQPRWHGQEIIAMEAVIITPPYLVEDCKAQKDKQETLNRVKKALEGERRKLKEKEERAAPRKGG